MSNPHLDHLSGHTQHFLKTCFQTKDTFDGSFALLYCVYGYMMLLLTWLSAVHGVAVAAVALFL